MTTKQNWWNSCPAQADGAKKDSSDGAWFNQIPAVQQAADQYTITAGPSVEALFLALRLRHEGRAVEFSVLAPSLGLGTVGSTRSFGKPIRFLVDAISVEDGSGHQWLIRLYDRNKVLGTDHLEGYYDSNTRHGWLKPLNP